MAKVLNKTKINGNVMKVVELSDEYIINGQLYDKNSFTPKPLQTVPIYGSVNHEALFLKKAFVDTSWNFNRSERSIIADKNDTNITWLAVSNAYSTSKIVKVESKSNGLETLETPSYAGHNNIEIISQDNDKLYLLEHTISSPYTIISTFNKNTMVKEFTYSMGIGKYKALLETNTFIYVVGFVYVASKNVLRIHKYNKFTGVGTVMFEDNEIGKATFGIVTDINSNGEFYTVKNNKVNSSIDEVAIKKYKLDSSNDTVTQSFLNINWGVHPTGSIPIVEDAYEITYDNFIVKDIDGEYFNFLRYNNGTVTSTLSPERCSVYTFKIQDDGHLQFVSETQLTPNLINAKLSMYDNKLLLLANGNGVQFFNWNASSKRFENTTSFNYPTTMIGIDMNNNIWIQQRDTSLDVLSNTLPIQISADFQDQNYDYSGDDIQSYVNIEATNFLGDYITASLELTLLGPVKFTSNGEKKLNITTSPSNKLIIPVTITGPGMVRVNTKYFS